MNSPPAADLRADLQPLLQRPLLFLVVAFLLGIVWADAFVPPPLIVTALVVLALALVGLAVWRLPKAALKLLPVAAFLFGAALHAWRLEPGNAARVPAEGLRLEQMVAFVSEVDKRDWSQGAVLAWKDSAGATVARVWVSLPPEPTVRAGDRIVLEEVELWRPRPGGTPGESDHARRLAREGIHLQGRAERIGPRLGRQQWRVTLEDGLVYTRARFLDTLTAAMPGPTPSTYAALLASMVYGMHTTPLPDAIIDLFKRSGTIHLLVASGSQVTIIALSLIFLVRGTRRVLPLWGMLVVAGGLVGLALLAGMGASINRAVAMAIVLLGTFAWGRKYDFPTAVALSALLLCVINTGTVFNVGAQLTYACAIGLYLALPRPTPGAPRRWLDNLLTTAAWGTFGAGVFSAPLLVAHFHSLVVVGMLANLIAVPLAVALLYLGMLAIVGGLLWLPLAVPLCYFARQLLDVMLLSNEFFASLPLAVVPNLYVGWPWLVLWYVAAGAAFGVLRSPGLRRRAAGLSWQRLVPATVLAAGILLLWLAWAQTRPAQLRVSVMDVGAGQCVLVEAPGGNVLVDAGASAQPGRARQVLQRRLLPFLALRHVRTLDAIVITHAHEDHCNLAAGIMTAIPTRLLLLGPPEGAGEDWLAMLQTARQIGAQMDSLRPGASLYLGPEAWLTVLEPRGPPPAGEHEINENSAVLRLTYGQTAVLFPADIMPAGERRLLRDYPETTGALRSEVLVAAHHAGWQSNGPGLLRAVAPRHVVVSCGGGRQAPRVEALRRFQEAGALVWRTDLLGVITVCSDGAQVSVEGHRTARR
jgi:competence protein ComEC